MPASRLINEGDRIKADAVEAFQKSTGKISKRIYDRVMDRLAALQVAGSIEEQQRLIAGIEQELLTILNSSGYPSEVAQFLRVFGDVTDNVIEVQQELSAITITPELLSPLQTAFVEDAAKYLTDAGIQYEFIQPIKDVLTNTFLTGADFGDVRTQLETLILGDAERLGGLERFVSQTATDSINQYDGLIQKKISTEFEMKWYRYSGSLIETSRPQCERWVEKFGGWLHESEFAQQIEWAINNGSGMVPTTTPSNFTIYRGGYNCRHRMIPVGDAAVPAAVKARIQS